ncbi:MAG: hypothetical protein LBP80_06745 [Treponema sp.]|jgi:hypothetical protein|nr:hypothetical protein [Treponema sp.]
MFEGIREGYKKSFQRGYRQARTRYEKRHQRDREQLEARLRQKDERILQYEEEIRRLRGE